MAITIGKVGVVGCGLMGSGIAQVSAQSGYPTTVVEVSQEALRVGLERIDRFLATGVSKGKVKPEEKQAAHDRLTGSTDVGTLRDCDLVIEAVVEDLRLKKETFARLDGIVKAEAIFASNTSSLSITEMASATRRPGRFIGLHFFSPVPLMKLVEIARTIVTDRDVEEAVSVFARSLGKSPIHTSDKTSSTDWESGTRAAPQMPCSNR